MKRTCDGCKALEPCVIRTRGSYCALGHDIESQRRYHEIPTDYKPLEQCEKPTSTRRFVELLSEYIKSCHITPPNKEI